MGTGLTSPEPGKANKYSPKIVFYARGGGLGHFNRAYAISRHLQRQQLFPLIFTSSALLPLTLQEGLRILRWPGDLENTSLQHSALERSPWDDLSSQALKILQHLAPDLLVVDSFPNGPEQELAEWHGPRLFIQRDASPSWEGPSVYAQPEGDGYILNRDLDELLPRAQARQWWQVTDQRPLIVVAHNGNPAETTAFFWRIQKALAGLDAHLRLASLLPCPRPEWQSIWCSHFPLSEWLHGIDLLIGGGGYNLVAEVQGFGVPALLTAFERPNDQQWQRIQSMPHFSAHDSSEQIRTQVLQALAAPRPHALPEQKGAHCSAQKIQDLITRLRRDPLY